MNPLSLSVVIPVSNSRESLPPLLVRLNEVLGVISTSTEVILVNDGSIDGSWDVIVSLAEQYPYVRGIDLKRNYGQHNALLCGIRAAHHDLIVTMDDDLQHPPEEIPKLLAEIKAGADAVYGFPTREQHGLLRRIASRVTKQVLQASMGAENAARVSAFRVFRTHLRDAFAAYQGPYVSIDVLLTWGTTLFSAVPVSHEPRRTGTSQYTFRKLITHAFNMMTGFSVLPLQVASLIGFACAFFGLLILVYVIGRYFMLGYSVPGFPFLASIIAIFSGAQLLALGVIGEYLARMHFRMMERPSYAIQRCTGTRPT